MLSAQKKHKMRQVAKEVMHHLLEAGKLDFEYTNPGGEADVSEALFQAIFEGRGPADLGARVAKGQGAGLAQNVFVVAHLLTLHHCRDFRVHVPTSLKNAYEVFEVQKLPVHLYKELDEVQPGQGDLVVLRPADVAKYLTEARAAQLNELQVTAMTAVDALSLPKDAAELTSVARVFNEGLAEVTGPLCRLNSFILAVDDSAILALEGLKVSHLFIRFEEDGFAKEYQEAMGLVNRLTISTPTKLGADILRVLLREPGFSGRYAGALVE